MFKTVYIFLNKIFLKKILIISSIFFSLIIILSLLEEINFFKEASASFIIPILSATLNAPSVLFEIFPFIFLISTQFFYIELIDKRELGTLKVSGISNLKIIFNIVVSSFILGILIVVIYYQFSAKLKFIYLDLKNSYSDDNKYLAIVTKNGLWIKDEINEKILIINSKEIDGEYLISNSITEFDKNFFLLKVIESPKIDISTFEWKIQDPIISVNNQILDSQEDIIIETHFDKEKINSLYSDLTSLNFFQLNDLKKEYLELGYSVKEIDSKLNNLYSFPFYLSLMTALTSIIMLRIKINRPLSFHIIFGILLSVLLYYLTFLFRVLGENDKFPILISIWLPLIIILLITLTGLIRINEK
ncbi:LptF/LptG family permease [Candidatus Pelagibacter sp.]|uniref:LptF/LptG family permease n=1 Tax=Candidatus Pelagibacter sp. TaxID=2024849 RepID=UPI003F829389